MVLTPAKLIASLHVLPQGCTLLKSGNTGNLAIMVGERYVGYIDLSDGSIDVWSEEWHLEQLAAGEECTVVDCPRLKKEVWW